MIQAAANTVSSKANVFSALDSAPMTPAHYLYWLLASGGTLLDGFSVVSLGIALPLLKRDFAITPTMLGFIGSALVLGAVLGAAVGGMAADRIGRKRAFLADMAILAVGSALCVIAQGPWLILVGQFALGIGIGIDFPTSGSYVSEITPKAARSRMTVATIALQSVGMIAAALVGIAVLRLHPAMTDWRAETASPLSADSTTAASARNDIDDGENAARAEQNAMTKRRLRRNMTETRTTTPGRYPTFRARIGARSISGCDGPNVCNGR